MEVDKLPDSLFSVSPISLALALFIILITSGFFILKKRNLPPGPIGLPYLGYLPFLKDENVTSKMEELMKRYGDIFSFTITGCLFIHLGSCKALRDVHVSKSECFDGRMPLFNFLEQLRGNGIISINGERWHTLRKYFLGVLKKRLLITERESIVPIYDSINSTIKDLRDAKGKPMDLNPILIHIMANNLRFRLFGDDGASEEQIQKMMELHIETLKAIRPLNLLITGPLARNVLFPLNPAISKAIQNHRDIEKIVLDIVEEHKSTYDEKNMRNVIDEYFKERDFRLKKGDPTAKYFTDAALIQNIIHFLNDGVVDVAIVIKNVIQLLIENPEMQEKIYNEIVDIIGTDRQPNVGDRGKLIYLNAFIYEGMRKIKFLSIFPGWRCIKETTVNGYRIPKGAMTLLNMNSCRNDPEMYEDPQKFNPSRFVSMDGKKRPDLPIVFGVGKRTCLGQAYVLEQVYLLLANLVQNFQLKNADDTKLHSKELSMKLNLEVCAHPRSHN